MPDEKSIDEQLLDLETKKSELIKSKNKGESLEERIKAFTDEDLGLLMLEKIVEHVGNHPTLWTIFQEIKARAEKRHEVKPAEPEPPPPPPPPA